MDARVINYTSGHISYSHARLLAIIPTNKLIRLFRKSLIGIAVTPVVGFIGELNNLALSPNPDEVEQLFTVPLEDLLDFKKWTIKHFSTPVFTGGPFPIWGLTAYLLHRFVTDVVQKCKTGLSAPDGI